MAKEKALFGVWGEIKASEINRLLKAHGVRLVVKGSKLWGNKVNVTAQRLPQPTDVVVLKQDGGQPVGGPDAG